MVYFFMLPEGECQNQLLADSLKNELASTSLSDSSRLQMLMEISRKSADPKEIIEVSNDLLALAKELQEALYIHSAYNSLGTAYLFLGDLEKSFHYLFKSASVAEENGLQTQLGESYAGIATTYAKSEDLFNCVLFEKKAIEIFRKSNELQSLSITVMNAGYHYYQMGNLDSALVFTNRAKSFFDSTNFRAGQAYAIGNRALIYAERGDYLKAELDLSEAVKILESFGDRYAISDYMKELGQIYFRTNQIDKAIHIAKRSLAIAEKGGFKEQVRDAHYLLYSCYSAEKKYQQALENHVSYISHRDSINNLKTVQRMADQRTEFEVGQKQAELDIVTAEKKTREVVLIGVGTLAFVLIILAIVIYQFYQSKARVNKLLETQKHELETLNATKDKFFSIISHDLRGPVSSFFGISRMIKFFVETKDTDQLIEVADNIDQSVERLSNLLDNLLAWAMQQQGQVPFHPERLCAMEIVEEQLATFSNMASGKGVKLSVSVPEGLEFTADKNMVQTILRNLINNALKFTPKEGEVEVLGQLTGDMVLLQVKDTGQGMSPDKLSNLFNLEEKKSTYGTAGEKGLGLGLQLVHEFIDMNHGRIQVESEEGKGTCFNVWLPAA